MLKLAEKNFGFANMVVTLNSVIMNRAALDEI